MKIPVAIAEIVSEFTGIHRTPDFKPVTSTTNCRRCPVTGECQGHSPQHSGSSTPTRKDSYEKKPEGNRDRRHSINIAVGVDKIPVLSVPPPDLPSTPEQPRFTKGREGRRQSAPCISAFANSTSLKGKLQKIKRTNSSGSDNGLKEEDEEDFYTNNDRKASVASYRLV